MSLPLLSSNTQAAREADAKVAAWMHAEHAEIIPPVSRVIRVGVRAVSPRGHVVNVVGLQWSIVQPFTRCAVCASVVSVTVDGLLILSSVAEIRDTLGEVTGADILRTLNRMAQAMADEHAQDIARARMFSRPR